MEGARLLPGSQDPRGAAGGADARGQQRPSLAAPDAQQPHRTRERPEGAGFCRPRCLRAALGRTSVWGESTGNGPGS